MCTSCKQKVVEKKSMAWDLDGEFHSGNYAHFHCYLNTSIATNIVCDLKLTFKKVLPQLIILLEIQSVNIHDAPH